MKKFNLSVIIFGLALTVLAGTAIAAEVPSDGLVAYYACSGNFDNSAPTSLPQSVNYGATFAVDRFGNANSACYFNGNEAYIEVPDDDAFSIITTGALTVSAWMSPEVLNFDITDNCYVHWLGKGESGQHEWTFRMYNKDITCSEDNDRHNRISAYAFNLGGNLGSGSYVQEAVTAGEWIHIVARYDTVSNTITIFKNGAQKDQDPLHDNTYNVVPENGTAPFRMGTRSKWTYFQGRIDDVRIYNRALYDEEILALYNEAAPSSSSQAASSSSNLITSSSSLSPTSNSSESSSTSSDISSSSAEPAYSSSSANSSSSSGFSSSSAEPNSSSSEPQSNSSGDFSSSSAEPNSSSESEISSSSSGTEKILPLGKALLSPENKGSGAIYRANGQKAPEGFSTRNRAKGTYYKKIRQ